MINVLKLKNKSVDLNARARSKGISISDMTIMVKLKADLTTRFSKICK